MILADHEIAGLCNGLLAKPLVDPFDPSRVQPASIDLTLGNEFITFRDLAKQGITEVDMNNPPHGAGYKLSLQGDEFYALAPMEFVLGVTRERICLPPSIAGKLDGKSSLARFGLLIHVTGGFVDPGFQGPLTLEIFNAFPVTILLRPGRPVCQIGFSAMSSQVAKPYSGRYQNATGVEASKYTG